MKKLNFTIVLTALAVSAPRLTLAFLIGDNVSIPDRTEVMILTVTGIASGMVLTVGNAVLAHALASKAHSRGALWWLCALSWVTFLVGAVVLVAPTLLLGLRQSPMAEIMGSTTAEWVWAIVAVVIVELLVGAAMAAMILVDEHEPTVKPSAKPSRWGRLLDAAVDRAASQLAEPSEPFAIGHNLPQITTNGPPELEAANQKRTRAKQDALVQVLAILRHDPGATLEEIGNQIGRKKSTISGYLDELEQAGQLHRTESGITVQNLQGSA